MEQLHKRFTNKQVGAILKGYCQGILERVSIQKMLGINKTRFFALLKEYFALGINYFLFLVDKNFSP